MDSLAIAHIRSRLSHSKVLVHACVVHEQANCRISHHAMYYTNSLICRTNADKISTDRVGTINPVPLSIEFSTTSHFWLPLVYYNMLSSLAAPNSLSLFSTYPRPCLSQRQKQGISWKSGRCVVTAKFDLKPPPFPLDALEPHMSKETFEYHWGKHHRAYVENLNKQIVGTELDGMSLEDIILATYNKGDLLPPFNNAAQAWNHEFFWESMKPGGGGKPSGELLRLIERDFGSFEALIQELKTAAATQFGSGWAWLVYKANRLNVENAVNPRPTEEDKKLVVVKSPNAVNPLLWDYSPLLTIDVWEHAYYLDYQNRRPDYVSVFLEKLVSWDAVSARLERAKAVVAEREREEEIKRQQEEENEWTSRDAVEMYLDDDDDADTSETE